MAEWNENAHQTNDELTLRASIYTAVEENARFLDIRRTFTKDGRVLPTKRGFRVATSVEDLNAISQGIGELANLTKLDVEAGGVSMGRRNVYLLLQKMAGANGGGGSYRLRLSRVDALWLRDAIDDLAVVVESLPDEVDEEQQAQPQEVW